MKEINLDSLLTPTRKLTVGGNEFEIDDLKIKKTFKAVDMYQKAQEMVSTNEKLSQYVSDSKYAQKYLSRMIDLCVFIIRPEFKYGNIKKYFRSLKISKKWVLNNINVDQLGEMIGKVLDPIIGKETKKKMEVIEALKDMISTK